MTLHTPHQLGKSGEIAAVKFLIESNHAILARNWRGTHGEIDIIALGKGEEIIFVEVKTRSTARYGDPFEAITPEKYRRIFRLAREWIALHHPNSPWRIDVILLMKSVSGFELVHHVGLIA